jgi:two-component system nitrate/nitrite response regulator NarL
LEGDPAADDAGVPVRLLIVDDSDAYRAGMVRAADAHHGVDLVAEADGGAAALDAIARHRPDVALVDLRMPNVDGVDVCRGVARLEPATDCKVVILSAATEAGIHDEALDAGAIAFLTKDLPRKQILDMVLSLVGRHAAAGVR